MATKHPDTPKIIKARVLQDCQFGKCNDVVEVADLTGLEGLLDADPAGVKYAESLKA